MEKHTASADCRNTPYYFVVIRSFIRVKDPLRFSLGYLTREGVSTGPSASITNKCSTICPSNGSKWLRQMGEGGLLAYEGGVGGVC